MRPTPATPRWRGPTSSGPGWRGWWRCGWGGRWTPSPGSPTRGAGPFDLVFLDADKPSTPEYLRWALELTRPGSLIVADNVVRAGAVLEGSSRDPNVQGIRRFYEQVAAEPRLSATAIQTVGSKGYDGLAIALVLPEA